MGILICSITAKSQAQHNPNDKVSSFNWDIIDMVMFKKVNDTTVIPVYSESVQRFENRHFQLTGYMIPMKAGMKQTKFMISTLPINQCYFCGKNGNPIMVIVNAKSPVTFTFKTVTVDGILKLDNGNAFYLPPVYLNDAKLIEQ
ncbi:hypothetical protein EPL05_21870 [Mucilaginibacter gilvus]|uniref:DUF3299 domain-containing protein n=2 Tax=Mucilaginibacter gilvus TaxID=2305909 RepID=A0A444MI72_9SPHI|nr:hypothetical protein EPL05_21870 [Mucilaginibacter gilvus]